MINKVNAEMYCAEPIELIENYDNAVADQTQVWHCHHIWETMLGYSKEELIEMNEYYGIPACNLIFLTPYEHLKLHKTGNKHSLGKLHSEETKKKMSLSHKGIKKSEEWRKKISVSSTGKKMSEEACIKMSFAKKGKYNTKKSKPVLQFTIDGEFIREFPSISEVKRQLGFKSATTMVSRCCLGNCKTAYGYIWKYK